MGDRMTIGQMYPGRIHPAALQKERQQTASTNSGMQPGAFQNLLDNQLLTFSNHAAKRLEQRGIELKSDQLDQIRSAVDKAAAKGSKESLILMKDMAFIVNVTNRTVVTAMDNQAMKDNVFTKIDSAVIIS